jgi:hypothetical protein
MNERITEVSTVIYRGLGALDGEFPKSEAVSTNWLIFDRNCLHIPNAEDLDRLPPGSGLIFVPARVARPPKNRSA